MSNWEENVRKVVPYVPGEQPQREHMIKLNTNENPYPPAPGVQKVLDTFAVDKLRLYPDPVVGKLNAAIAQYYGVKTRDNDYVVVSKKGTHATARNVSRTLGDILENCSFTDKEKKYGLHSLRHTFASLLLAKGADIKSISEILGHEKTSTTYDIYAHLIADQKNTAIDLLDTI